MVAERCDGDNGGAESFSCSLLCFVIVFSEEQGTSLCSVLVGFVLFDCHGNASVASGWNSISLGKPLDNHFELSSGELLIPSWPSFQA